MGGQQIFGQENLGASEFGALSNSPGKGWHRHYCKETAVSRPAASFPFEQTSPTLFTMTDQNRFHDDNTLCA